MRTKLISSAALLLAAATSIATGCRDPNAPPYAGILQIIVTGPPGASAAVTVSGPAGYSRLLTGTRTLSSLVPGTYSITAANVVESTATYGGVPSSATVAVVASNTADSVSVPYELVSGALDLTVAGPPGGGIAKVTITGPGGFSQTVSASQTFSNVLAGAYTITDSNVVVSNATYGTTPSSTTVNVAASSAPTAASVAYVLVSGALNLTVAGPPGGGIAKVTITGPGGFSQTVSASQTFSNVLAGAYTITDSNVVVSNATYGTTPPSTTVTVVASNTPTPASVAYVLVSGSIDITVSGLPAGAMASVNVTGPGGFNQTVTAPATIANVLAGTYIVAGNTVSQGGVLYGAALSPQVVVSASLTVSAPASLTYAVVPTGQLAVVVSVYSTSCIPYILVAGPYNYLTAIRTSGVTTLASVPLGTIVVTAYDVYFRPVNRGRVNRCYAHPASQNVVISAVAPSGAASVAYTLTP